MPCLNQVVSVYQVDWLNYTSSSSKGYVELQHILTHTNEPLQRTGADPRDKSCLPSILLLKHTSKMPAIQTLRVRAALKKLTPRIRTNAYNSDHKTYNYCNAIYFVKRIAQAAVALVLLLASKLLPICGVLTKH